jgi:CRISPR type III-B/RAMP module RAMP protein Cmr1
MQIETHPLELVTPAFLGGAQGTAEWRAASLRGQLRWWFRALAGGRYGGDAAAVRKAEERIFGSTERRSSLRLRVRAGSAGTSTDLAPFEDDHGANEIARRAGLGLEADPRLRLTARSGEEIKANPLHYLAYGPIYQKERQKHCRPYLQPASRAVTVELDWRRPVPGQEDLELFQLAWDAWLHLGGIGARSRKGWGSLQNGRPARKEVETKVRALLAVGLDFSHQPEWTHLSSGSRVFLGRDTFPSWQEALSRLGSWLIAFRRRYGAPFDERVPLKDRDYEWAAAKGQSPREGIPDRAGFGLPLPFSKEDVVTWMDPAGEGDPGTARRASPLLLHVTRLDDGYLPVLTYLPARFVPVGSRLSFAKGRQPSPALQEPQPPQLDIVTRFLSGLVERRRIEEVV